MQRQRYRSNTDHDQTPCVKIIKGYYSKFLEREENNLDVEVDKWATLYNKVPVDYMPQDVCTVLAACEPNDFPSINRILVIFVQHRLVVFHVKDHFLPFAA